MKISGRKLFSVTAQIWGRCGCFRLEERYRKHARGFDIRKENVSDSKCLLLPDVFLIEEITKTEMSPQAHRWLLLLTVLAD